MSSIKMLGFKSRTYFSIDFSLSLTKLYIRSSNTESSQLCIQLEESVERMKLKFERNVKKNQSCGS